MAPPNPNSPPPSPLIPSHPPSYTYSDPFAPPPIQYSDPFAPPTSPYFDRLAPSASPTFDVDSLLSLDNYQSSAAGDDFLPPQNSQFYTGGNSFSLENNQPYAGNNFLAHENYQSGAGNNFLSHANYQSGAGNNYSSLENNQSGAGDGLLLPGNCEPYAGNNPLSLENYQTNRLFSFENYGNNFISFENHQPYAGNTSLPPLNFQPLAGNNSLAPIPWDWRANLPVGMKFRPTDEELIIYYLKPYILHGASPPGGPISAEDIYKYEPHELQDIGEDHGDGKRYFIPPVKKIGKSKTHRFLTKKKGFWKPTQGPKPIISTTTNGAIKVGEKIPLAFHGEDQRKTQWLMQELKLPKNDDDSSEHHVEIVLAVVYYHRNVKSRGGAKIIGAVCQI